ncbi:predicted protein, partial [Nematostella vectensis]
FIPTCRDDGSFAEVQCHGLTGQCWCVDMNGIEIPGSVTRGHRPDCKKAAQTTSCQRQRTAALGLTGRPNSARYLPQCKPTGRYEEVQCHTGTGLCWCVDERGQEITRTRTWGYPRCHMAPKSECYNRRREAAHARSARRLSGFPFFVSQCQPDGGFTPLQCHSATGFCWCVDGNGNELAGTRVWGRNNCTEINGK